jgi:hypothetical protein
MNVPPPLLDPENAALLEGGVSITVGGRDAQMRPCLARAFGARISEDRRQVTVFLSRRQARPLLDAIEANGALAAVFSEPSSHRSLQVKATDARILPAAPEDVAQVAAYRGAFVDEVGRLGFPGPLVRALLAAPPEDLVAVAFTPGAAHHQTPGPLAGTPLGEAP